MKTDQQIAAEVDPLSMGIDAIDRRLGGGFEAGSLVSLITPPSAQSHAVLSELIRQRPTLYITTLRSKTAIEKTFDSLRDEDTTVTIEAVGNAGGGASSKLSQLTDSEIHSIKTTERDRIMDEISETIESVHETTNIIIDVVNPLERSSSRGDYQNLLRTISEKLIETDSLGLLHCVQLESPTPFRETTLTFSDVLWELEVVPGRKNSLEIHSRIPKNRGGEAILEDMTLVIDGDTVYIDDSRNI